MYRQLPNTLTMLRLVLAAAFFVVLNFFRYQGPTPGSDPQTAILFVAIGLFVLAAVTDAFDGYLARKWHVESKFGRIMDPFCDKVLILGALIYLAGPRFVIPESIRPAERGDFFNMISGVYPWMVVVIFARELLVTGIRGELEAEGVKFGANVWGKLKMILQSIVVPVVILLVWIDPLRPGREWAGWTRDVLVYATVIVSILSGIPYVTAARRAARSTTPDPDPDADSP